MVDTKALLDLVLANSHTANLPRHFCTLKSKLTDFVKRASRFRRTPATHIFVIMISDEYRRIKPYAIPVQCLPYAGMTERDVRRLLCNLICEMEKCGMT